MIYDELFLLLVATSISTVLVDFAPSFDGACRENKRLPNYRSKCCPSSRVLKSKESSLKMCQGSHFTRQCIYSKQFNLNYSSLKMCCDLHNQNPICTLEKHINSLVFYELNIGYTTALILVLKCPPSSSS